VLEALEVPDLVARRLDYLGQAGSDWLEQLPERVATLAAQWDLELGEVLSGGTGALVLAVERPGRSPAVLKLLVPAEPNQLPVYEAQVLAAAQGRGYATLLASSADGQAMLLQRLGKTLAEVLPHEPSQQRVLCETLQRAWETTELPAGLQTGAEKARWLAELIERLAKRHPLAVSKATMELALYFCGEREAAHEKAEKVLVHGDPHEHNALQDDTGGFCFVDPDGLLAEKAYDVGVVMREASEALLGQPYAQATLAEVSDAAPLQLGLDHCQRLARLSGTDAQAVWQWGFIERVSSGLYTLELNMPDYAGPALLVANSWAQQAARDAFASGADILPLPALEVRESAIHGNGLFAVESIAAGSVIGWCEVEPAAVPGPHTLWCDDGPVNVVCDLRFTNHSEHPNVVYYDTLRVVALHDIAAGEELTYNYGQVDF